MTIQNNFRGRSRKSSSAGKAFAKGKGASQSGDSGKFGDGRFLKRLLGKALQGNDSGLIGLLLLAQLGDPEAIQMLAESGLDAKDNLGLVSLAIAALTGDIDAKRILADKGLSVEKKQPIFIVPQHQH